LGQLQSKVKRLEKLRNVADLDEEPVKLESKSSSEEGRPVAEDVIQPVEAGSQEGFR